VLHEDSPGSGSIFPFRAAFLPPSWAIKKFDASCSACYTIYSDRTQGGSAMAHVSQNRSFCAALSIDEVLEEICTDNNIERILREIGEGKRITGILRG
jgi:hypothetical protein